MAYLEEILPEIRKGRKVRRERGDGMSFMPVYNKSIRILMEMSLGHRPNEPVVGYVRSRWVMAKPVNKAESKWKYWREWVPLKNSDGRQDRFIPWAKRQMAKARRRFNKKETQVPDNG